MPPPYQRQQPRLFEQCKAGLCCLRHLKALQTSHAQPPLAHLGVQQRVHAIRPLHTLLNPQHPLLSLAQHPLLSLLLALHLGFSRCPRRVRRLGRLLLELRMHRLPLALRLRYLLLTLHLRRLRRLCRQAQLVAAVGLAETTGTQEAPLATSQPVEPPERL